MAGAEGSSDTKMDSLYTEPPPTAEVDSGKKSVTLLKVVKEPDHRRALFSVVPTLTIGIMGGAVLPLAWAFSVTGIISGTVVMVVVAAANAYTSDLLLRQAHVTGTFDYESLAFVVGGKWWKLATEVSIVVLLIGTLVGGMSQTGEVGQIGLLSIWPNLPTWLVGSHARLIITLSVLFITGPLSLVKQLRQLEYAGMLGTTIVLWLMITIMVNSISHGLPSIGSKELAVGGFSSIGNISQAVSIFGFAFYIQPIIMPLLSEVPAGLVGMKIVSYSTRITVLVNAFLIYFFIGFFGAAYYGQNTSSDILENQWLGGGVAQGILNICMAVYLAMANPLIEFPTRHTIDGWIPRRYLKNRFFRHLLITSLVLGLALAITLLFPGSSGNVLVVTGATGVCMVSYLIPIVNHLLLHYNRSKIQKDSLSRTAPGSSIHGPSGTDLEENKSIKAAPSLEYRRTNTNSFWSDVIEYSRDVVLPIVVLLVGIFCSVAALYTLGQG